MSYWESTTMGGIYQTYGLAFFLLGVVSTMLPRQNKTLHFTRHLVFLALFGILHGMAEFIEIQRLNNPVEWLVWLSRLLLLVSYLPLFEFGRRTWNGISSSVWLPASWTYSAVGFIVAMLMLWAAAPLAGLTAGSRWFIGAPAAMLTSLALLATQHSLKRTYLTSRSVFWLHIIASAFICYSFSTIFLSQRDLHLPAWLPTQADFLALFGFPVQLLRAVCAGMVTVGFISLLRQAGENSQVDATTFESQESIVITDANRVILRVNEAFSESTRYKAEEVAGHKTKFLTPELHDEVFYEAMWESINRIGVWRGEVCDQRKNGEIYPKWLNITAVCDADSVVTHYVGTHIDISERKQSEALLRASEERFRRMANSSPVMIWITNAIGEPTFVNQSWLDFTGLDSVQTMTYEDWISTIHPDDKKTASVACYQNTEVHEAITTEYRLRSANGGWRWILDKCMPLYGERGVFIGYIGSAIDVTERKQVQQILQDKEQMLSESQRIAHIGSWSMELATGCISWSDEMYQIYGFTQKTFGHSVNAFLDVIYPGRETMKMWSSDCLAGWEGATGTGFPGYATRWHRSFYLWQVVDCNTMK